MGPTVQLMSQSLDYLVMPQALSRHKHLRWGNFPGEPFGKSFSFEGQFCNPQLACDGSHGADICCSWEGSGSAVGSCPRALSWGVRRSPYCHAKGAGCCLLQGHGAIGGMNTLLTQRLTLCWVKLFAFASRHQDANILCWVQNCWDKKITQSHPREVKVGSLELLKEGRERQK